MSWRDRHDGATLDDLLPYLRSILIGQKVLLARTSKLEEIMATAAEQLDALSAKVDDIAADVAVLAGKAGQLDAEGQAALDRLTNKLTDLDVQVGDQDGSDQPPA